MFRLTLIVIVASLVAGFSWSEKLAAQGNSGKIDRPGEFNKYLTPGMSDRWDFIGKQDQTIVVQLETDDFDSVISLIKPEGDQEKVLFEIDDEGSGGSFSFRLPADGAYKIGVRGFENRGGGNYSLSFRQFISRTVNVDEPISGSFDGEGKSWLRFQSPGDQYVTMETSGQGIANFSVLDTQGRPLRTWGRLAVLKKPGEYAIELDGGRDQRYELIVRSARRHHWENGQSELTQTLEPRQAAVVDIPGKVGEIRLIEVTAKQSLNAVLVDAPAPGEEENAMNMSDSGPVFATLPVGSKAESLRYAVIWRRNVRYQLRLTSETGGEIRIRYTDPCEAVNAPQSVESNLAVGGSRFFRLMPQAGQTTTIKATTGAFDPVIQLFDMSGNDVASDDDGADGLNCRVQHTSYTNDPVLVVVSSLGNGGGGNFQLDIDSLEAQKLTIGRVETRRAGEGGADHWSFDAKADQCVIFHVKSGSQARMELRNANGVRLESSNIGQFPAGTVLLFRFPANGSYSLWITLPFGEEYTLQAIETR